MGLDTSGLERPTERKEDAAGVTALLVRRVSLGDWRTLRTRLSECVGENTSPSGDIQNPIKVIDHDRDRCIQFRAIDRRMHASASRVAGGIRASHQAVFFDF